MFKEVPFQSEVERFVYWRSNAAFRQASVCCITDNQQLLQIPDITGDEEEREVVYDWIYLFSTSRH